MDPRDFFPIAAQFKTSAKESERRTSIGRSYYALYNSVIGLLSSKGVVFRKTPEDHYTLISYLTKVSHRTAGSVGSALKFLRIERNRADYEMRVLIDAKTSEFVYQKAATALEQFTSIPPAELTLIIERIQALL